MIPALGGALSSFFLIRVLQYLEAAENAGSEAVFGALTEAILPSLVSLYLGAVGGLIVIIVLIARMLMQTKTASPSVWFFILCGFLFLVPAGLFFEAESLIIEVLTDQSFSIRIADVASNIYLISILSIISALAVSLLLLIMSVVPFSARSDPRWSSLIAAVFIEFLIIAPVVAFQLRFLWLYKAGSFEGV
ncbi:MAG: hypothetical protein IPM25_06105 [Chloracidobacterium sp.]|nr:hypothetical protein [Chloracidobacterium sp.]